MMPSQYEGMQSPLQSGTLLPGVQLPDNFVPRPHALNAVKQLLLSETGQSVVINAILGLGGLGKSVLATALVLDQEVQAQFPDGILWVTLGQNPDLQTLLGDWIRQLNPSRESFSANTLDAASRYLASLLADKQLLLVVDDLWDVTHLSWFRVGGANCRMLVTTREANISGASSYCLDLMSEAEAIALVQQKLGSQWRSEQEDEVKAFTKVLGYLPLALDLATDQVRNGLSWTELRVEFIGEQKSIALEVLDTADSWELLDENQQRQYSLQACFNLSLRRLNPEQLKQFAGLGVLPEDVNLSAHVAAVLWDIPVSQAQKGLRELRQRSLLLDGIITIGDDPTYRIHDLLHDLARNLSNAGMLLPLLSLENSPLELAHQQFLNRYRDKATDQRWDQLPNDGYIHRHLTWHLEQAKWPHEIHQLITMNDPQGRNAWFEACERLGQPAIFVEDIARGWALAERAYAQDPSTSIVLQCHYALITATLNSLVENIPADLMLAAVRCGYWTVEQAWAYAEQIQGDRRFSQAMIALLPELPPSLMPRAISRAHAIRNNYCRADVLVALERNQNQQQPSPPKKQLLLSRKEALAAIDQIKNMENRGSRVNALYQLAHQLPGDCLKAALKTAFLIRDDVPYALAMLKIAHQNPDYQEEVILETLLLNFNDTDLSQVLTVAAENYTFSLFPHFVESVNSIKNLERQAQIFLTATKKGGCYYQNTLAVVQRIQNACGRAWCLIQLAKLQGIDPATLFEVSKTIRSKVDRAQVLVKLVKLDRVYLPEALAVTQSIQKPMIRTEILIDLAKLDSTCVSEAAVAMQTIQIEQIRIRLLEELIGLNPSYCTALLTAVQTIEDEINRTAKLCELAQLDSADFKSLLQAAQTLQSENDQTSLLHELAQLDSADLIALFKIVKTFQDQYNRARILCDLAKRDSTYFPVALSAAREIPFDNNRCIEGTSQPGYSRAYIMCDLAELNDTYFAEALTSIQEVRSEYCQFNLLGKLAKLNSANFTSLLEVAKTIQDKSLRYKILDNLTKRDSADLETRFQYTPAQSKAHFEYAPADLPYGQWQGRLRSLARRQRSDLIQGLATLYPAILHLGGETAIHDVITVMRKVCSQWN